MTSPALLTDLPKVLELTVILTSVVDPVSSSIKLLVVPAPVTKFQLVGVLEPIGPKSTPIIAALATLGIIPNPIAVVTMPKVCLKFIITPQPKENLDSLLFSASIIT